MKEMDMDRIWVEERNGEYNNSHVRVELYKEEFTEDDRKHFEELIERDVKKLKMFGDLSGVFYAKVEHYDGYDCLEFDIHKGDFIAAQRLSGEFPDAVVFVNDDWDDHAFAVYKNNNPYHDYEVAWEGDEPEPYNDENREEWEDEQEYYDIDVEINIKLPNGSIAKTMSGGGMCTKEEFEAYRDEVNDSALLKMNLSARNEYDIVLVQSDEALSKETLRELLDKVNGDKIVPVEIEAGEHECFASGYVSEAVAEDDMEGLEKFVAEILDDVNKESENGEYSFESACGNTYSMYLGYEKVLERKEQSSLSDNQKETVQDLLEQAYNLLDRIQEMDIAQDNEEMMDEIGEAMGHIDNAIDEMKEKEEERDDI